MKITIHNDDVNYDGSIDWDKVDPRDQSIGWGGTRVLGVDPRDITELQCLNVLVKVLPDLPKCKILNVGKCRFLKELPLIPMCEELECWCCYMLESLPDLPECRKLKCASSPLLRVTLNLPKCTYLECGGCPLLEFGYLPVCVFLYPFSRYYYKKEADKEAFARLLKCHMPEMKDLYPTEYMIEYRKHWGVTKRVWPRVSTD